MIIPSKVLFRSLALICMVIPPLAGHAQERVRARDLGVAPGIFAALRLCYYLLLFELGIDQVLEREDFVPMLLSEQLFLLDDDVVQRLAGLVALAGDFRALLVAQ